MTLLSNSSAPEHGRSMPSVQSRVILAADGLSRNHYICVHCLQLQDTCHTMYWIQQADPVPLALTPDILKNSQFDSDIA